MQMSGYQTPKSIFNLIQFNLRVGATYKIYRLARGGGGGEERGVDLCIVQKNMQFFSQGLPIAALYVYVCSYRRIQGIAMDNILILLYGRLKLWGGGEFGVLYCVPLMVSSGFPAFVFIFVIYLFVYF